jgi:NADPH:quinone reductase-like Zn-dependent oxidoreductase
MQAIVQRGFGEPAEALELQAIDRPSVADDDVLIRVHAASIHIGDVYGVRGLPKAMRPLFRSMQPKNRVVGTDLAGTVAAVGASVAVLKPGDEVYGTGQGAFAEYAVAKEALLTHKPAVLSFVQAAAIGVSAYTALQGIRDHAKVRSGQQVLVAGASGGVGTYAVQIAKSLGAEVTGVCSTRNVDLVRSLGADHVIDYTQQDYTQGPPAYDVIFDNVGTRSLTQTRRPLKPGGILIPNGAGAPSGWFGGLGRPLQAALVSLFVREQGRGFYSRASADDLAVLTELAAASTITPVIDRTYSLDFGIEALSHVGEGHARGTTVLSMVGD